MDACELSVLFYAMSAQSLLPPPLLSAAPIGHPGVHCSVAGRSWIRLWGGRDGSAVIFPASWYWICKNLESRASQHKLFFLQTSQCIAVFFFLLGGWSKVYSDRWAHWVTALKTPEAAGTRSTAGPLRFCISEVWTFSRIIFFKIIWNSNIVLACSKNVLYLVCFLYMR